MSTYSDAIARRVLIDGARNGPDGQAAGGWTREQLAEWNVPWPAPPGWRVQLIMYGIPYKTPRLDADDALSHDPDPAKDAERKGKADV